MNCAHHPTTAAIALCRSCARGVCAECGVDIGNGLTCPGACEQRGRGINVANDRAIAAYAQVGTIPWRNLLLVAGLAIFFIGLGLSSTGTLQVLSLLLGVVVMAYGAWTYYAAAALKRAG